MKKSRLACVLVTAAICWTLSSAQILADETPDTETILTESPELSAEDLEGADPIFLDLEDGEYSISVDLKGGSGKASVSTPTLLIVSEAQAYARLVWSSSNYDYMIVGGTKYLNTAEEEANSTFEIPILAMDVPMEVVGDTTAMGTPHEVTYHLTFYSETIDSKSALPQEAAKKVVMIALAIIIGGGILNAFVKKKMRA